MTFAILCVCVCGPPGIIGDMIPTFCQRTAALSISVVAGRRADIIMAASMSLRSCLLCGTQLITCKHYVSLNCSSTKANPSIMNLADEVSHITKLEIHELKVKYVCSTCQRKVLKVKSSRQASEEIQRKYEATIITPVTSPKKRISKKRTAEASPGTPSVKVRIEVIALTMTYTYFGV